MSDNSTCVQCGGTEVHASTGTDHGPGIGFKPGPCPNCQPIALSIIDMIENLIDAAPALETLSDLEAALAVEYLSSEDVPKLIALGKAVEGLERRVEPNSAGFVGPVDRGWNDCLDAIYREADL